MSTPSLSADQLARARKIEQLVLQRLASAGQVHVALSLGVDESTISRLKEGRLQQLAEMLAVLGLKVVPTEIRCFEERDIEAVLRQAKRWMEHVQGVDQLEFD